MAAQTIVIPLRERKSDFFFIVIFALFAYTSLFGDALHALGWVDAHDGGAMAWYVNASQDHFFAAGHEFTRISTGISAFVYGPFYLLLVYAFIAGRNFIRPMALVYVGAIVQGTFMFVWWEYTIGPPPGVASVFWDFNGPYLLIPILLAARMWRADPFTRTAPAEPGGA